MSRRDFAEEQLDRFEAAIEHLIAEFLPEEKERATVALACFRDMRRGGRPILAAHNALAAVVKLGALKVVTCDGGWELHK